MIHITTDVAVVGSGTGGVSAAYHCAIAGLNTTLFEAGKGFGPALTGVNGVFAVGTAYQKSKHINESKKDIFLRLTMGESVDKFINDKAKDLENHEEA